MTNLLDIALLIAKCVTVYVVAVVVLAGILHLLFESR
jgi:hypothetical protein